MVALVAAFAMAIQAPTVFPDRADFLRNLKALPDRAPKADVLKALGKPDRIESRESSNDGKPRLEETWFYGTDGPKGAATLARFEIFDGKLAYHPVFEDPPKPSEISEAELRKGLHIILDTMPLDYGTSNRELSVWVAKTANGLLPFGEAKCKAILGECGRLMEGYAQLDGCPFFLCLALFDPPKPPDTFALLQPVWDAPRPEDGKEHPRWPVEIIDNVPIIRGKPVSVFGGFAPSFAFAYQHLRAKIHLRTTPLSLPK